MLALVGCTDSFKVAEIPALPEAAERAPRLSEVTIQPQRAAIGTTVAINFLIDQSIENEPVVTVAGFAASKDEPLESTVKVVQRDTAQYTDITKPR